jgi:hypothetical protein
MKSFGAKTLAFPTPVWVVGTFDQDERPSNHEMIYLFRPKAIRINQDLIMLL